MRRWKLYVILTELLLHRTQEFTAKVQLSNFTQKPPSGIDEHGYTTIRKSKQDIIMVAKYNYLNALIGVVSWIRNMSNDSTCVNDTGRRFR